MWNCDSGVEVKRAVQGLGDMLCVWEGLYARTMVTTDKETEVMESKHEESNAI